MISKDFPPASLAVLMLSLGCAGSVMTEVTSHPLDPLTHSEYAEVLRVLEASSYSDRVGLYPLITLDEPAKDVVLNWTAGDPIARRAFVVAMDGPRTYEAIVDLQRGQLSGWKEIHDVQPSVLLSEEWALVQKLVRGNSEWREALRRRGIDDPREVVCSPHTVGHYDPTPTSTRLLKVSCYHPAGARNFWGRPIGGLLAIVDVGRGELIRVIDSGVIPVPSAPADIGSESDLNSNSIPRNVNKPFWQRKSGPAGFEIRGHQVSWKNWRFHFRIDPRVGPVISLVRYEFDGRLRSVLYQGYLSELFVPYMDPGEGWYFKTYLDAGEYGLGKLAASLQPGLDCPANAVFFDAVFADDWGLSYSRERIACLFERDAGEMAWRHFEAVGGHTDVLKRTDLVYRSTSAVGNYDYVFDWVFRQDGTIRVAVGTTGTEQVKAVQSRSLASPNAEQDIAYGTLVAPNTVAVNHDHFFNFRLDLDVDGRENSFVLERLISQTAKSGSTRRSFWRVEENTPTNEEEAKLRIDLERPALWRVIHARTRGPLGYPVSYQLRPERNTVSLLDPEDPAQQRARFTDYHLWVTPYRPNERYAAGAYPNQSAGNEGLPRWTKGNRPIEATDLVLWYTFGFHHVVRAEDWPILSTGWSGFELRPFNFFARNPTLDLPLRPEP